MEDKPMTTWTSDELSRIEATDQLQIAPIRRDGTLRNPVPIWVVRHGDDFYVRSAYGRRAAWFRGIQARGAGHIQAGGVDKDVTVEEADHDRDAKMAVEYRAKYRRYSANLIDYMVSPEARSTTIKLVPRSSTS